MIRRKLIVAVTGAVLCTGGTAYAQSPTQDAYGGSAGQQLQATTGSSAPDSAAAVVRPATIFQQAQRVAPTQTAAASADRLPFTGMQLIALTLTGLGLLGFGIALRRASRDPA